MSNEEQVKAPGAELSKNSSAGLMEQIPPEAVGEAVLAITQTISRTLEIREISAARRREVENQIDLLRAESQCHINKMEMLSELLSENIEDFSSEDRSQLIQTLCNLAMSRENNR